MSTEIPRTPAAGADDVVAVTAAAVDVPLPVPDRPSAEAQVLFAGRIASEAAMIHRDIQSLLGAGRPLDERLLDGLRGVEGEVARFARRLQQPDAACAGRCTPHLIRDARRSIVDAHALVGEVLARPSR